MITNFPAMAGRYVYNNEDDGTFGRWDVDVTREPKENFKKKSIECVYNFESKELLRLDEAQGE